MTAMLMAESKNSSGKKSTLKVSQDAQRLVAKIAAHRNKSVEELFEMKDVREFFTHLLIEEMRKEELRLKDKK